VHECVSWCTQGDIADEEFSQYFSQFGEIEDCVVSIFLFLASAGLN